jgi:uncharacterized protein (TIGR03067 family)
MLQRLVIAALGLAFLSPIPALAVEPDGLNGTWIEVPYRPSRAEHPGYRVSMDPATLVIDGESFVIKHGDRPVRRSLVNLIPSEGPTKAADLMTVVSGEFWRTPAIYKLEGETLTICEAGRDRPRPTDFRRWQGGDEELTLLRIFKRQPEAASLAE